MPGDEQVRLARDLKVLFDAVPPDGAITAGPISALATRIGPRSENQDRAFVALLPEHPGGPRPIFVAAVLDGMGGMQDGARAASVAASTFLAAIASAAAAPIGTILQDSIGAANDAVFADLRGTGGTTLTAIAGELGDQMWFVHAGDSRLYNAAAGADLVQLTSDDTLSGLLGLDDDLSLGGGLIQFVGIGERFISQGGKVSCPPGGSLLLTTDGGHAIGRDLIRAAIETASGLQEATSKLMESVAGHAIQDNASAVIISARPRVYDDFRAPIAGGEIWTTRGRHDLGAPARNS